MMDCIIIEDQLPAQRILIRYIGDMNELKLKATFTNAIDAKEYLKENTVDLVFLDIHLPKLSGIDFLKTINTPLQVILTTAFTEYAIESYELNVIDYLLKPFSYQRFLQAVNKAENKQNPGNVVKKDIYIKSGYELIKINLDEVLYIKSDTDYTEFYLQDKKHLSSEPLRYWEQTLKTNSFVRVHKSYIVNIKGIEKVGSNQVFLVQEHQIPIGRAYKEDFLKEFNT